MCNLASFVCHDRFLPFYIHCPVTRSRPQTVEKNEQADMCLVAMGPCGLYFHAVVGEEKTFSSTLLGSVPGALQIKVMKDR